MAINGIDSIVICSCHIRPVQMRNSLGSMMLGAALMKQ